MKRPVAGAQMRPCVLGEQERAGQQKLHERVPLVLGELVAGSHVLKSCIGHAASRRPNL